MSCWSRKKRGIDPLPIFLIIAILVVFQNVALMAKDAKICVKPPVKTGIEVLKESGFEILRGKRVGLITNQTGVDNHLKSTIDVLFESPDVNLVALFAPEHGVRGDQYAGQRIAHSVDAKTGLPIFSLFGKSKRPSKDLFKGIDIIVYDIQDIGCRSFTFISTMGLAMDAAGEYGVEFLVLDRPNPLGGLKVEGLFTDSNQISFVSQYKIPYIYGLTAGELALLINGEGLNRHKCKLSIVQMEGWRRDMLYSETGLQWVPPSPHIPTAETALFYPTTGIVGELGCVSIGVGYTLPFKIFAAEWIDAEVFAERMNGYGLAGVLFRPIQIKPFYSVFSNKIIKGVQIHIMDYAEVRLTEIQFYCAELLAKLYPDKSLFNISDNKRFDMFDKVAGSTKIREIFSRTNNFLDICAIWRGDEYNFRLLSEKYKLYK